MKHLVTLAVMFLISPVFASDKHGDNAFYKINIASKNGKELRLFGVLVNGPIIITATNKNLFLLETNLANKNSIVYDPSCIAFLVTSKSLIGYYKRHAVQENNHYNKDVYYISLQPEDFINIVNSDIKTNISNYIIEEANFNLKNHSSKNNENTPNGCNKSMCVKENNGGFNETSYNVSCGRLSFEFSSQGEFGVNINIIK